MDMISIRITAKPDQKSKHWNLKVGCCYEMATDEAAALIKAGIATPVEVAMKPAPGGKNIAHKSSRSNCIAGNACRRKEPPASDARRR